MTIMEQRHSAAGARARACLLREGIIEARRPKDHAIIAEMDGKVVYGRDYKNKRRIAIESSEDPDHKVEYMVPKGKHIPVAEGDFVQKGDYIMDGNPAPHDILRILGIEALANYLIDEVQKVYRLQGVPINDKHIEIICAQMMRKVEIESVGDSSFLPGEVVDKFVFKKENEKLTNSVKITNPVDASDLQVGQIT